MSSKASSKRRKESSRKNAVDLDKIRDAEIQRREYKTPKQIEEETKYVYGNDVYTVSRILAKRLCNGRKEYLIKWHGYPKSEATWEPATNILDPSVIKKFEAKNSVHINVSHADVRKASDDLEEEESDGERERRRRRRKEKKRALKRHHSRREKSDRKWKKIKKFSEEEEEEQESDGDEKEEKDCESGNEDQQDQKSDMSIDESCEQQTYDQEVTVEQPTPAESISRDGDSSSEEIAEEPLTEREIRQWILGGPIIGPCEDSAEKESDSSRSSSNLSEIRDIVNMMTERVAMEIGDATTHVATTTDLPPPPPLDLNNNEAPKYEPEVSHSIEILPPENGDNGNETFMYTERAQGSILGSAIRSGTRVYLVKWSSGCRQVLTHDDVKQKWPQLLIKFYESNIHWLKRLK